MEKLIDAVKSIIAILRDGKVEQAELPAFLNALADIFAAAAEFTAGKVKLVLAGIATTLRLAGTVIG